MADLVNRIKQRIPNECLKKGKLTKEGCTVSKKGAPKPSIAIDIDHKKAPVKKGEAKCDYIFIGGSNEVFVVPLELTKQEFDLSKAVTQLRAGAKVAARIILDSEDVQFRPVAVCKGRVRPDKKRELRRKANKIRFKNAPSTVKVLKHKEPLINALRG